MYRWEFNAHANRRLSLESALRHAIERQQMCVAYQPRVSLSRHRVVGVEALLRWRHPEEGWISPQEFIPVAEDTGLIVPLGYWVLRTALFQLQEWHDAGHADLRLAVNLSCRQFREEKLEAEIERTLWESQAASRHVDIEITESTLMDNTEISRSVLRSLKCLGFGIALDDFGTGYSSLSYLKRFPIDILKIDKTFVRDIPDDPDSSAITAALIALARALHMEVVAEGVETLAQLEYLRDQGCDEMQGYLFSHAIAAAAVPTFLESYARNEPSFVEPVES